MRVIQDMGGWVYLCGHETSYLPLVSKEFEARYKASAVDSGGEDAAMLVGKFVGDPVLVNTTSSKRSIGYTTGESGV
jgi:hypothetical protein